MKTIRCFSWLAVAAMVLIGCSTRIDPYRPVNGGGQQGGGGSQGGGQGGGGQVDPPTQTVTKRTDWTLEYKGRVSLAIAGGQSETLEEFLFGYTGNKYFIMRTLSEQDYETFYSSDPKQLIDGELKDLRTTAENQKAEIKDIAFVKTDKTKYFDILIHGSYLAFIIECDSKGNPTYNYNVTEIEVVQETATQAFTDWIGTWLVSDGYVGYDIEVSPIENNYLYRVDGWETGSAAAVQMNEDDDWIQARFVADGTLSFFIQFIASYDNYEDLGTVDYMFVGTYAESTGEKVDSYEGWELAYAERLGGSVTLKGGTSEFEVNGQVYKPHYNAMHYSLYSWKTEEWNHFNQATPLFREANDWGISMTRTKATVSKDRTPVHTRNYLRKTQPRVHVEGRKLTR